MMEIAHCRNVRGLRKSVACLFEKLDTQMKDQLNLSVLSKIRSI